MLLLEDLVFLLVSLLFQSSFALRSRLDRIYQYDLQLVIVERLSKFVIVAMVVVWTSSSVVMETR